MKLQSSLPKVTNYKVVDPICGQETTHETSLQRPLWTRLLTSILESTQGHLCLC